MDKIMVRKDTRRIKIIDENYESWIRILKDYDKKSY